MTATALSQVRLLYVEDEISIREEIVEVLREECKELYFASDGEEGLELYHANKPDIILTDIRMPKLNGLAMSQEIRRVDPKIPI